MPVFHKSTDNTGEICGEGLRTITFIPGHAIRLKKNNHFVFMCQTANKVECQHVVCHKCHEEHSKAQKRSRGGVLCHNELIQSCHHELCNLQSCADIWWHTRDYLGGP